MSGGAISCVDHPWWGMTWLGWYVQLSGHDILFPERISANPLPYCFDSSFSPHTFEASWMNPVLNPPEFLIMFNCQTDRWTFTKFSILLRVWKFENGIFCNWEWQSQPRGFTWHPTICWCCDRREQIALAQVPVGRVVQKQHLIVSSFGQQESCNITYSRTMYLWNYVQFLKCHKNVHTSIEIFIHSLPEFGFR